MGGGSAWALLAYPVYAVIAGGVLFMLWRTIPAGLRWPVLAYVVCLASMAAQAAATWWGARGTEEAGRARQLAIGGALFVVSDALLAVNRFAMPLPMSGLADPVDLLDRPVVHRVVAGAVGAPPVRPGLARPSPRHVLTAAAPLTSP